MASELHVDAIKHSGGTSAMTIDSSGRIVTPARPAFRAHKTDGDITATNNYIPNVANFNVGGHYSTSTGKFTCPIDGVYVFYANVLSTDNQATNDLSLYLNSVSSDNLIIRSRVDNGGNSNSYQTANFHFVGSFSATDELFLRVTNGAFYGQERDWCQFGGYLLG